MTCTAAGTCGGSEGEQRQSRGQRLVVTLSRVMMCLIVFLRLKTNEGSTHLVYTGCSSGNCTPKNKDEVNRREVRECDG
jgi:hypothetical protein